MNYRRRYNLDQLVKEYEARLAAEKAISVTDDVKEEKKDEKPCAPVAQSNTNESANTKEKTPESQPSPADLAKVTKSDSNPLKRDAVSVVSYFI